MPLTPDKVNDFPLTKTLRLLIPILEGNDATRAISYAIRRRAEDRPIQIFLLHVENNHDLSWPVQGSEQQQSRGPGEGGGKVFSELTQLLEGLDIQVSAHVRSGPLIFSILDAAEELACDEIVVPAPRRNPFGVFAQSVSAVLLAQQRSVLVVPVSKHGVGFDSGTR